MAQKYKNFCKKCNKNYIGYGKFFCSNDCATKSGLRGHFNPHTEETKKKIANTLKGRKPNFIWTSEKREKIRIAKLGNNNPMYGKPAWNKGLSWSKEAKQKMSLSQKQNYKNGRESPFVKIWKENPDFMKGKNSPNWIENRTKIKHLEVRNNPEYKQWRIKILNKDNYRCMICGEIKKGEMIADHVFSFTKYSRLRYEIENGQTLCRECHQIKTNFELRKNTPVIFATSY